MATQEAYDRLGGAGTPLQRALRRDCAQDYGLARSGPGNGGYHAAREQAMNETRLGQLTRYLGTQRSVKPQRTTALSSPAVVTAEIFGEESKFLLGSRMASAVWSWRFTPDAPG